MPQPKHQHWHVPCIMYPMQDSIAKNSLSVTYGLQIPRGGPFRWLGMKSYELTNHLGNVMATVSDRKIDSVWSSGLTTLYAPDIRSASDYYAYGWEKPGRTLNSENYRFGMNGQIKDYEITDGTYGAKFWEYDSRVGTRREPDPVLKPYLSPYMTFSNNPVWKVDPNGDDDYFNNKGDFLYSDKKVSRTIIILSNDRKIGTQLKDISFNSYTLYAAAKVFNHYLKEANTDQNKLPGKSVGVANVEEFKGGAPYKASFYNNGQVSGYSTGLMNANNGNFSVTLDQGKIDNLLNDGNNIVSSLYHEKYHIDHNEHLTGVSHSSHVKNFNNQKKHSSWKNTTTAYKKFINANIKRYSK